MESKISFKSSPFPNPTRRYLDFYNSRNGKNRFVDSLKEILTKRKIEILIKYFSSEYNKFIILKDTEKLEKLLKAINNYMNNSHLLEGEKGDLQIIVDEISKITQKNTHYF
jgi:hypothetical protein